MHSEGTVIVLSVCLSVLKLARSKFICSTNDTTYLTHNKGVKFCGIFSETAPLQSQSPSSIVQLLHKLAIFSSTDKRMHILQHMCQGFSNSVYHYYNMVCFYRTL